MGRLPRNPPTPQRQVGTMYPDFLDEPGPRGRDSPLGLLIAPGILMWLVPGSPAVPYLGVGRATLKRIGKLFEAFGQRFDPARISVLQQGSRGRGALATCLVHFVG